LLGVPLPIGRFPGVHFLGSLCPGGYSNHSMDRTKNVVQEGVNAGRQQAAEYIDFIDLGSPQIRGWCTIPGVRKRLRTLEDSLVTHVGPDHSYLLYRYNGSLADRGGSFSPLEVGSSRRGSRGQLAKESQPALLMHFMYHQALFANLPPIR
jgi:hypothetical protein